jgi:hypothetical protein
MPKEFQDTPFTFETYKAFIREYEQLVFPYLRFKHSSQKPPEYGKIQRKVEGALPAFYRARLPRYLLARCPICGGSVASAADITEAVDTFSLAGPGWWREEPLGFGWYGLLPKPGGLYKFKTQPSYHAPCGHVQALTYGICLNGIHPDDVRHRHRVYIGSERPGLAGSFLEERGNYAVLHTLPVGRLDDEVWQPRYTAYFVTYFKEALGGVRRMTFPPQAGNPPCFNWRYGQWDYDLRAWLRRGKLFWLGPEAEGYPLRQKPVRDFPYDALDGLRGPWVLEAGDLHLYPDLAMPAYKQSDPRIQADLDRLARREQRALQERGLSKPPVGGPEPTPEDPDQVAPVSSASGGLRRWCERLVAYFREPLS